MTSSADKVLINLLWTYPEESEEIAEALAELATYDSEYAEPVARGLKRSLKENNSGVPITKRLEAIIVLAQEYPDVLRHAGELRAGEQLARVAEDGYHRGYQALAILTTLSPEVKPYKVVDIVGDGLSESRSDVRRTAVWALTTIGLEHPAEITRVRPQLVDLLGRSTYRVTPEIRCHVVEALAVNATGRHEPGALAPPSDPLSVAPEQTAAWGIQQCVAEEAVEIETFRQRRDSTTIDHYGIAAALVDPLKTRAANAEDHVAAGAVHALGQLGSSVTDDKELRDFLYEIFDRGGDRARAAEWVLDNRFDDDSGESDEDLLEGLDVEWSYWDTDPTSN